MENNKASTVARPTKKRSFEWVLEWSLAETSLLQHNRAAIKTNLTPELKSLTPSQAANSLTLQNAMLWFSVAGAGAALLAMLLKSRAMIRRALAWVGLSFAVAIHCVLTWLLGVTVATAVNDWLLFESITAAVAFIIFAVVDVNAALALLGRPGWDWEEEEYVANK